MVADSKCPANTFDGMSLKINFLEFRTVCLRLIFVQQSILDPRVIFPVAAIRIISGLVADFCANRIVFDVNAASG